MNILILNPNTSADMTTRLVEVAGAAASPGTRLTALTAPRGVPYISSRTEAQVAGAVVLEMLAEHAGAADAVVIAAYGDPALTAAREMLDIPVVGMAEAAMLTACMLGQRFGVVTFSAALVPWYAEGVALSGLGPRCAGIRTPAAGFASVATVRDELRGALADTCGRMAREDGADVAILAGAPLAGLATALADEAPIVLLDPVSAAVRQAETLARLAPRGASRGSFARPAPKPTTGLPEALARRIEGR